MNTELVNTAMARTFPCPCGCGVQNGCPCGCISEEDHLKKMKAAAIEKREKGQEYLRVYNEEDIHSKKMKKHCVLIALLCELGPGTELDAEFIRFLLEEHGIEMELHAKHLCTHKPRIPGVTTGGGGYFAFGPVLLRSGKMFKLNPVFF